MDANGALYAFPDLRKVTGDTLRPGGLAVTEAALELCNLPPGGLIADIGCGAGASLEFFRQRGFCVLGIDNSPLLLAEAKDKAFVLRADAQHLPLTTASVDAVFCECVLSLLADPATMLRECSRVLKPAGSLIVSDLISRRANKGACACAAMPQPAASRSCAEGALDKETLAALLHSAGFAVRHTRDFSQALRELAARIVWEFGSLEAFGALWNSYSQDPRESVCRCAVPLPPALRASGLGYMLFIANKVSML